MSLYSKIIDLQKLNAAWKKVRANKPAAGIDDVTWEMYDADSVQENKYTRKEFIMIRCHKLLFCIIFGVLLLHSTTGVISASNLPGVNEDVYITCYPLNTSDRIYAVSADNRYIDPGDECYITAIDGIRVYVSYPTSKGRHSEWFNREEFSVADMSYANFPTITAPRKITTYKNATGGEQFGYLYEGDVCYVLTKTYGRTQLVYPVSKGYKMGWVDSGEIYEGTNARVMSIHSALDIGKVMDVDSGSHADSANILLYTEHGGNNQGFEMIPVGNYYVFVNTESGKALDVQGGVSGSGVNVQLYTVNYSDAQQWEAIETGDSKTYYLKNKLGCYLDVCGGVANDCANIWCMREMDPMPRSSSLNHYQSQLSSLTIWIFYGIRTMSATSLQISHHIQLILMASVGRRVSACGM